MMSASQRWAGWHGSKDSAKRQGGSAGASLAGLALSFSFRDCRVIFAAEFCDVDGGLRDLDVHRFHGGDDDFGDGEIAEPLVVGGYDEPGGTVAIASREGVFVGAEVVIPALALGVVGFT